MVSTAISQCCPIFKAQLGGGFILYFPIEFTRDLPLALAVPSKRKRRALFFFYALPTGTTFNSDVSSHLVCHYSISLFIPFLTVRAAMLFHSSFVGAGQI